MTEIEQVADLKKRVENALGAFGNDLDLENYTEPEISGRCEALTWMFVAWLESLEKLLKDWLEAEQWDMNLDDFDNGNGRGDLREEVVINE